ncbi:T9SS type A sorting domain-containing protein [Rhodocaloribacter sp.]
MDGPTCLEPNQNGTFTADVWDGVKTLHYQWYYFSSCAGGAAPKPYGPPCGSWTAYGGDLASISVSNDQDFQLKVEVTDATGTMVTSGTFYVAIDPYNGCNLAPAGKTNQSQITRKSNPSLPEEYALLQNYPNPFNPSTEIRFALPEAGQVSLVVYDVTGREVTRLAEGFLEAGFHSVVWEAPPLSSGLYLYRLTAGNFTATRRMMLLK